MQIYQPARGVGPAQKDYSYMILDDVGVEIGKGGLIFRMMKKTFEDRPLNIEMIMESHPTARDTLYGALDACAERIKAQNGGVPARLYTRCGIADQERYAYFTSMGFDGQDGVELFVRPLREGDASLNCYQPTGCQSVDAALHTRARREMFLRRLSDLGDEMHAEEWLLDQMQNPVFMAKVVMYDQEFVGALLMTGSPKEAILHMVGVEPKWRSRGVATGLIEEAMMQLYRQQIPYLVLWAQRRNKRMMRLMKRCEFQWIRTEELLLGRDL